MRIHLLSDLHLECEDFVPPVDDADVVVLAGDICPHQRGVTWAEEAFNCAVIYIPGNHEFYGGDLTDTLQKMRAAAGDNVWILDCEEIVIGNVRFLGMTMWTDFSSTGNTEKASRTAQNAIPDFKCIRAEKSRFIEPADLIARSLASRSWLTECLATPFDGKTVVITHHAPSMKSLEGSPHAGGLLDGAFANAWDDLIVAPVDLWLHGHTHFPVDYVINGTRVVSNPRGYPGEVEGFDPTLVLEV